MNVWAKMLFYLNTVWSTERVLARVDHEVYKQMEVFAQ